jgi:hypothetical protein
MAELTGEGRRRVADLAARHGVSAAAGEALAAALLAGSRTQAQFSIPELGGMGQWSQGGMVMVGDMFDNALKARVDALCGELAALLALPAVAVSGAAWWPADLGRPASAGAQNDMRYAFFPAARRLAVEEAGRVTVYDTGEHVLSGFSQQQSGSRTLSFASQLGPVRLAELRAVQDAEPAPDAKPAAARPEAGSDDDVFGKLERLHELYARGILTAVEFEAKKKELLARV